MLARFPDRELLSAPAIVDLHHYEQQLDAEDFEEKTDSLIRYYGMERGLVPPIIDGNKLRQQQADYMAVAPNNAAVARLEHKRLAPEKPVLSVGNKAAGQSAAHSPAQITLFWRVMKGRPLFDEMLSNWDRLAHIAIVTVGTRLADERTVSIMKFVTEQRPSLTMHLELTVRAAEQTMFGLSIAFALGAAL